MKILVVSDIHDNLEKLKALSEKDEQVDLVFFLGDLTSPFTLRKILSFLPEHVKIFGVFGNNDGDKPTILKTGGSRVDLVDIPRFTNIEGLKIFLAHGFGSPEATQYIIRSIAKSLDYDIVLYGHTHMGELVCINRKTRSEERILNIKEWTGDSFETDLDLTKDVLLLNPGEFGGWLFGRSTYAVLDIKDTKVKVLIKKL